MKWFVANITQEQGTGEGAVFDVISNSLASQKHLGHHAPQQPPLNQFLQNVLSPLDTVFANALTE